jgi:PAS domain S-box-containing protein
MNKKIKVLYIDDNQLDQELVRDALEMESGGFELTTTDRQETFLEALQTGNFDIVLSDFNILGFEGIDVIKAVQKKDPRIPVVIVTGTGSEETAVQSLKQGATDYVIKQPQHIRRLPETLHLALEKKKLRDDREAAERLRDEALTRLKMALKFSNVGLWDWDIVTNRDFLSKEWKSQLGFEEDELEGTYKEWVDRIHPEDKDRVIQINQQYLDNEIPNYDVEFRLKHKDGSYRWIQSTGEVLLDENQKPVRMLGCHIDITERKNAEMQILKALNEKEVLLREVHHRVKNNLQIITSLLTLQENDVQSPEFKEMLAEIRNRVRAMAYIHENLLESDNLELIDMAGYLSNLGVSLIQTFNIADDQLDLVLNIDKTALSIDVATAIGQIVNELVSNSLKHGLVDDRKNVLAIELNCTDESQCQLVVRDNGVGLPKDFDWRNSDRLGLRLVRMLVENQLEGRIELDSTAGCRFVITFPN